LKLIKKPRWLFSTILTPERFAKESLPDLISLVLAIGAPDEQKAECLYELGKNVEEAASCRAVKALAQISDSAALKFFPQVARFPFESVILMSLVHMIRKKHPDLRAVIGEHLNSPYPRVQKLARNYYQKIAFDCYWEKFDTLSQERRVQAGRAIYKIDSQAHSRWKKYAFDPSPLRRLKAVRMARILGQVGAWVTDMIRLTRDEDRIVRSCAIAALGESDKSGEGGVVNCLYDALRDSDFRVQANAIEALQYQQGQPVAERISPFTHSPNNRVRANAIKTLLTWKVDSAQQAIQQMLRDPRVPHRRSAQWVVNNSIPVDRRPNRLEEMFDAVGV